MDHHKEENFYETERRNVYDQVEGMVGGFLLL